MPPASPVPRWMGIGLCGVLAIVAGFGLSGLALAVLGLFVPVLAVPLGAAASVALFRCAQPRVLELSPARADAFPALGALAVALGSLCVNLTHSAQHLLIDRDPGAYVNTGRWLASHSGLVFRADVGPFATMTGLKYSSPAVYGHGRAMHFQFSHLEGVLLAEALARRRPSHVRADADHRRGLARDVLRAGLSIRAAVARAPRDHGARRRRGAAALLRDAYSEIVLQLVLLGSMWILGLPGLTVRRAVFSGVLLGTCVAARIDGPLYLAAVPVLAGIAASRHGPAADSIDDGIRPDVVKGFVAAVAAVAVLGIVDVSWRVPEYVRLQGWRVAAEYGG